MVFWCVCVNGVNCSVDTTYQEPSQLYGTGLGFVVDRPLFRDEVDLFESTIPLNVVELFKSIRQFTCFLFLTLL